jgi:hypothetical protein
LCSRPSTRQCFGTSPHFKIQNLAKNFKKGRKAHIGDLPLLGPGGGEPEESAAVLVPNRRSVLDHGSMNYLEPERCYCIVYGTYIRVCMWKEGENPVPDPAPPPLISLIQRAWRQPGNGRLLYIWDGPCGVQSSTERACYFDL